MQIRKFLQEVPGGVYLLDNICLHSGPGGRHFNNLTWLTSVRAVKERMEMVEQMMHFLQEKASPHFLDDIIHWLCQVLDIHNTLHSLAGKVPVDDVGLFQAKDFTLTAMRIREHWQKHQFTLLTLPDLEPVITLLDPDGKRIREFYIYDAYDDQLREAREKLRQLIAQKAPTEEIEAQQQLAFTLEDEARVTLLEKLQPVVYLLQDALETIGKFDLLLALAQFALEEECTLPEIIEAGNRDDPTYEGLFHPGVRANVKEKGLRYQAIDMTLTPGVTLITGANMAGKSVLLHTLQLAQGLVQYGLFVPARKARVRLFPSIFTSFGDKENTAGGLSSYGAEMMHLNSLIQKVNEGQRPLVLLDELARTTNPTEGSAIVGGVVRYLEQHEVCAVVTTHFSSIKAACRRLRVRGLQKMIQQHIPMGIEQLNASMDYSLEEVPMGSVPHEALAVARMLGVDDGLLALCEEMLEQ